MQSAHGILPDELFMYTFSFLNAGNLANAGVSCTRWKRIADSEILWQQLCREKFGEMNLPKNPPSQGWKAFFLHGALLESLTNIRNADFIPRENIIKVQDEGWPDEYLICNSTLIKKFSGYTSSIRVWDLTTETELDFDDSVSSHIPLGAATQSIGQISIGWKELLHILRGCLAFNVAQNTLAFLQRDLIAIANLHDVNELTFFPYKAKQVIVFPAKIYLTKEHLLVLEEDREKTLHCYIRTCKILKRNGEVFKDLQGAIFGLGFTNHYAYYIFETNIYSFNLHTGNETLLCQAPEMPTNCLDAEIIPLHVAGKYLVYANQNSLQLIDIKNPQSEQKIDIGTFTVDSIKNYGQILICGLKEGGVIFVDLTSASVIRHLAFSHPDKVNADFVGNKLIVNSADWIRIYDFSNDIK